MFNFLEIAARVIAFVVCCIVAVAGMLEYFDCLTK